MRVIHVGHAMRAYESTSRVRVPYIPRIQKQKSMSHACERCRAV